MRTRKTTDFLVQDPFEPTNDPIYLKYRSAMETELKGKADMTSSRVIEFLKRTPIYYRWDVFCWLIQNYPFYDEEICPMFKYSWLFSNPDVRAAELLRYYIDNKQLMNKSEQEELRKLPEEITIYKAIPSIDMEEEEDGKWDPGLDWKWSMSLGKVAYIARCLGAEYVVISTKVKKEEVRAYFHGVDFSYELIAEGNCKEREEYELVADNPAELLQSNPYYHTPITENEIYKNCGF